MSERKVLNKYYPPDFDPSKLPRVKREKNRQFIIRLMAPFNMRCKTCGEYIYRGKKFNARKEDVIGSTYLGIQIYRFYIKCTKCLAEITFLTDPEDQDYKMEFGAIRNFESVRLAEIQAEQDSKREKEEEENNPMKVLENRTRDSRREMAAIETLEDLRELNAAHSTVDLKVLLEENEEAKRRLEKLQEEEDEREVQRLFGKKKPASSIVDPSCNIIEEIIGEVDDEESDEEEVEELHSSSKKIKCEPAEIKIEPAQPAPSSVLFKKPAVCPLAPPIVSNKNKLSQLVKKKPEIVENSKSTHQEEVKPSALSSLAAYSSSDESD